MLFGHVCQGFQAMVNGDWFFFFFPDSFDRVLIKKSRCQIRLGVEVHGDDFFSQIRIHPGQMIEEGGFSHPADPGKDKRVGHPIRGDGVGHQEAALVAWTRRQQPVRVGVWH